MAQTLVNGTSYTWAQVVINIGGAIINGVTSVSWSETQEKSNNYGAGRNPVSRGRGNVEYEASITLHMDEVEAIRATSATGKLIDIAPFDVGVSWLPANGIVVNKNLKFAEFLNDPMDTSDGDTNIELELDLIIADIETKL